MKLEKIICTACGAQMNLDISGRKMVYCPYCGTQFFVNDGSKTINHNISINENVSINKRYTDDAAVENAKNLDRASERKYQKDRLETISTIILVPICLIFVGFFMWKTGMFETMKDSVGTIKVGQDAADMEGQKYQVLVEQLEAAGFTNIKTIDIDDSDSNASKKDKVDSISINGDTTFESNDRFAPDAKIIISYY